MTASATAQADAVRRSIAFRDACLSASDKGEPAPLSAAAQAQRARTPEEKFTDWLNGDEPKGHYWKPSRTFKAVELVEVEEDPITGCMLWTGDFADDRKGADSREYPVNRVAHDMCGRTHLWVARAFYEEALGRVLDLDERVMSTCEANAGRRRPCVAPAHHRLAVTR